MSMTSSWRAAALLLATVAAACGSTSDAEAPMQPLPPFPEPPPYEAPSVVLRAATTVEPITLDEVLKEHRRGVERARPRALDPNGDVLAELERVHEDLTALEGDANRALQRREKVATEALDEISSLRARRAQLATRVLVETPLDRPLPDILLHIAGLGGAR